jgi:hypothetical protein
MSAFKASGTTCTSQLLLSIVAANHDPYTRHKILHEVSKFSTFFIAVSLFLFIIQLILFIVAHFWFPFNNVIVVSWDYAELLSSFFWWKKNVLTSLFYTKKPTHSSWRWNKYWDIEKMVKVLHWVVDISISELPQINFILLAQRWGWTWSTVFWNQSCC